MTWSLIKYSVLDLSYNQFSFSVQAIVKVFCWWPYRGLKVASSLKRTHIKIRVHKPYPISDRPKRLKNHVSESTPISNPALFLNFIYLQQKENKVQLDNQIASYFKMAASNQLVRERYGTAVLDIPGHETVLRPKETLQRLCDHLGVTCSEDYFEKCSKILYGTPSFTRDTVVWTEEQKERVTKLMKKYPFMKEYSFNKYPS